MKIKITIETSNRAFEEQVRAEAARILRDLAESLDSGEYLDSETKLPAIDNNGNIVGYLTVE